VHSLFRQILHFDACYGGYGPHLYSFWLKGRTMYDFSLIICWFPVNWDIEVIIWWACKFYLLWIFYSSALFCFYSQFRLHLIFLMQINLFCFYRAFFVGSKLEFLANLMWYSLIKKFSFYLNLVSCTYFLFGCVKYYKTSSNGHNVVGNMCKFSIVIYLSAFQTVCIIYTLLSLYIDFYRIRMSIIYTTSNNNHFCYLISLSKY